MGVKVTQPAKRVGHLQQRALGVVTQAAEKLFWRRSEINDGGSFAQESSIRFAQHRTPARCDHSTSLSSQVFEYHRFNIAESGFSLALEELLDRAADSLLDRLVCIDEVDVDAARKMAPYGGFTTAGHADEGYGAPLHPTQFGLMQFFCSPKGLVKPAGGFDSEV